MTLPTLAIALVAVACDVTAGVGPMEPKNPEVVAPAGSDEAAYLAIAEWVRRAGPPAPEFGWLVPRVRWFEGFVRESDGKCCYLDYGRMQVYSQVWPTEAALHVTTLTPERRPSSSGLAHELLHWVLVASGRSGDQLHTSPLWAQVGEVNAALKGRGL